MSFAQTKNDGRRFENLVKTVADAYRRAGSLRLEKVEPPTRIVGARPNTRIIFLENPFADFIGAWIERAGKCVCLEAKSTQGDRLDFGSKLTDTQIDWQLRWHGAGAAVGVLWESNYRVAFIPIGTIHEIRSSGRRHIKFAEADPVPQGKGVILFDFVVNLRRWYPE